jgi:hypothetical protein
MKYIDATCVTESEPGKLKSRKRILFFTFDKNNLCSALIGTAKPLMIDPRISSSSPTPLNESSSYANSRKILLMDFRINPRSPKNFP